MKTYTPKPVRLPDAVRRTAEGNPYSESQWQRFEPRPVPPLNLRRAGELAVVGLAFALMVAAAAWSTTSVGVVLHGGVGYAVAGVFDVGWGVCLLLENLFLHDDDRLRLIRRTGWGLLAFTMAVLFARGAVEHNWLLAVAGCAGSGFAKAVWYVVMRCLEPDLTHDDKVNIRADRSRAQRAALRADMDADAARRTAYADARRAALLPPVPVAAEILTAKPTTAELPAQPEQITAQAAEPVLSQAQPVLQPLGHVGLVGSPAAMDQRSDLRVEPLAQPFGFTAQPGSAQVAQRLSRVSQAAELMATEPGLSASQVARRLGVSLASAKRYMADARQQH